MGVNYAQCYLEGSGKQSSKMQLCFSMGPGSFLLCGFRSPFGVRLVEILSVRDSQNKNMTKESYIPMVR